MSRNEMNFNSPDLANEFKKWLQFVKIILSGPLASKSQTEKCTVAMYCSMQDQQAEKFNVLR